jgi:hypothetical protein
MPEKRSAKDLHWTVCAVDGELHGGRTGSGQIHEDGLSCVLMPRSREYLLTSALTADFLDHARDVIEHQWPGRGAPA